MGEKLLGDVQQASHEDMCVKAEAMHSTLNCVHFSLWLQLWKLPDCESLAAADSAITRRHLMCSFQSQNVYCSSETSSLHSKSKPRNAWGQYNYVATLGYAFANLLV